MTAPLDRVLGQLQGVTRNGGGFLARCPVHEADGNGHRPSLSLKQDGDRILLHCFGGCATDRVLAALGLELQDLFADEPKHTKVNGSSKGGLGPIVATYDYTDEDGVLLYQATRHDPKDFRARRPDGAGGWIWSLKGVRRVLFGLPDLIDRTDVYLVEGEKDALALRALGLTATTTAGGARAWDRGKYAEQLVQAGCLRLTILPDNDEAGREYARQAAASCTTAGIAVKVLELPGLPSKGDVSDWLAAGHTGEDLTALAVAAPAAAAQGVHDEAQARQTERAPVTMLFRTAAELATVTPPKPEWIGPYLAASAITELDAKAKAGKTTFIAAEVDAILRRADFLGEPTAYTPVVWLTEERSSTFRETLRRAGLLEREDLWILSFADVVPLDWPDIAELADRELERRQARLLIVDTLSQFAKLDGDRENNSGDALMALAPLQRIAAKGRAVWLTRHERKGGGEVGESGRGSSAFAGGVDIVMALRRPEGNTRPTIRVIHALSRFDEVPAELAIEWMIPSAHPSTEVWAERFRALGTGAAVAAHEARAALLADLPDHESDALTLPEFLKSHSALARSNVQRALDGLLAETGHLIRRLGAGKKNDPYRYFRPVFVSAQTAYIDGQNESEDDGRMLWNREDANAGV